jgi:hypothetical protein
MTVMRRLGLTTFLIAAPRAALACPVCFGQSDSPMASAMNMGIFAMLLVVGGVLAAFASFFVHLIRRARLADESGPPGTADFGPAEAGDYVPGAAPGINTQGGTA